jgi:hypothetical protein
MIRSAPFIWTPEQLPDDRVSFVKLLREGSPRREDGCNRWYLFRRSFELASPPDEAMLRITVDGRFVLYVNGVRVCRGPARCSPERQRVEERPIAPYLRRGSNVLAVLVHVYGTDMGWYETAKGPWQSIFGDGGLFCDATVHGAGQQIRIGSGAEWRCIRCDAWRQDTPRAGWGQDFIEDFDARRMPAGWETFDFDDSSWPQAVIRRTVPSDSNLRRGWGPVEPFPVLIKSEIPPAVEGSVTAQRIVATYGLVPQPALAIDDRIYAEKLVALSENQIDHAEGLLGSSESVTWVRTAQGKDVGMLLKFDPLICGYPWFEVTAQGGEVIEVAVGETIPGEYTGQLPAQPRLFRETYLDCAHVVRYTAKPGRQRFEKFDWTAIRYLMLVVRNAPDGLQIHAIGATQTHYPAEERGSFQSSDPLLDRLWRIGRYTALQCTHDAWVDGPGREKRQWLGDGIVHYLVSAAGFGPSMEPVDRQFLIQAAENHRADGLLPMFFPGDHHDHSLVIPDFNLHWICTVQHYLLHTGNTEVVASVYPAIEQVLDWFALQTGPNGLLVDLPHWHFIEWANVRRDGEAAVVNAMYVGALQAAAEVAAHLGYAAARARHLARLEGISSALNARHWNSRRGLYVDTVDPESGEQCAQVSQHANACMILWDIAPRDRWPEIVAQIGDPELLRLTAVPPIVATEEALDPGHHIVRANTFFGFFVHEALAKAGRFDLALNLMRNFYGPMLESGTSTLWESHEPTASTCHAFSAGPVYHLSCHALGVRPLTPGFRRFQIAPQTADLQFAKGIYPTVRGDIHVEWARSERQFELRIEVPDGTEAEVKPPEGFVATGPVLHSGGAHTLQFAACMDDGGPQG